MYKGIALAVLAALIWSGNFIIARGVSGFISPVSLAFYRWLTATLILLPFCYKAFQRNRKIIISGLPYFFGISLTGITLFNTLVYVAGNYSGAINLALIGTTSSPIMAMFLAAIFLKEKITGAKLIGMLLCCAGILILLSGGDWNRLISFRFNTGDWWILASAFCFAIYNTMAKVKPVGIKPVDFLFIIFTMGMILLLPAYISDMYNGQPVEWNTNIVLIILYLGLGTSVISFLCWNLAIGKLGASRTALFGNLIPVFAALEAVVLLNEKITMIHLLSGLLVVAGLITANLARKTVIKQDS